MIYLLAKYTLLFILTALLGFVIGYWFSRRNIEDVTESFEDLRQANSRSDAVHWDRLFRHLETMPEPKETNLSGVYERIDSVESAVAHIPQPQPMDMTPVTMKLDSLEHRLNNLSRPQSVDLAPFDKRLKAIEIELAGLGQRLAEESPVEVAPRTTPGNEPRILSAALYGDKDNLQAISGVGPTLENLLNHNGVYYFWQVAEWSGEDIDVIDARLDVFKGRIARDNWVDQARQLRQQPDAAPRPDGI